MALISEAMPDLLEETVLGEVTQTYILPNALSVPPMTGVYGPSVLV